MNGTPVIRDGTPEDVDRMAWASSEDLRAAWRTQALRAVSGDVCFLVAVLDDQVVGKAVIDWVRHGHGAAWLWMFSVDPAFQGRGVGGRILVEAEARARDKGRPAVEMAVNDDNPRARALYLREGYTVTGPHLDEYDVKAPDGETVHVASPGVTLRKVL